MKRLGAFGLAMVYLLITTSVFICLLSCMAAHPDMISKSMQTSCGQNELDCSKPQSVMSGCDEKPVQPVKHGHKPGQMANCFCKQNNYFLKENLVPVAGFSGFSVVAIVHLPAHYTPEYPAVISLLTSNWPSDTGPPDQHAIPIYLSIRSLLI